MMILMAYVLNRNPAVSIPSDQLPHFIPVQPIFSYWQAAEISDSFLIPQVMPFSVPVS
jgi:hypothetical protein